MSRFSESQSQSQPISIHRRQSAASYSIGGAHQHEVFAVPHEAVSTEVIAPLFRRADGSPELLGHALGIPLVPAGPALRAAPDQGWLHRVQYSDLHPDYR